MSALDKSVLVARILEHVPLPFVPQAAEAFDLLVSTLHTEHGIDVTDMQGAIAAAREPWQRIHDTAERETHTDVSGQAHGGSIGD